MTSLRSTMQAFLQDWRDDVSPAWREMLDGVEPETAAIAEALTFDDGEVVLPGRKGQPAPGARADSHVFRALEGVRPSDVTAVILGQDPYPRASRATGRAFEQGDLAEWSANTKDVAESLRRIVQVVCHHRTAYDSYIESDAAWADVMADEESGELALAAPQALFDDWQAQGVLCINTGLTLSRFQQPVQEAHFALWRPVVRRLLTGLATRDKGALAVILWGGVAQSTFKDFGVMKAAEQAGTADRLAVVTHVHPAAEDAQGKPRFFAPPNTFTAAHDALVDVGGPSLRW